MEGERFLSGDVCMRGVIDGVMDETVRKNGCLEGKEELCSVCWKMRGGSDVMEREGLVDNDGDGVEEMGDGIMMMGDEGHGLEEVGDDGNDVVMIGDEEDGMKKMVDDRDEGHGLEEVGDDGNDVVTMGDEGDGVKKMVDDRDGLGEMEDGRDSFGVMDDDEIGVEMVDYNEVGVGMMGDDEVGVGMIGDDEVGVGMMGSGEVGLGGDESISDDDGDGSDDDGDGSGDDGDGSDNDRDRSGDDGDGSDDDGDGSNDDGDGSDDGKNGKRKVGEMMDVNQMVRDVREGQRRVRMRLGEVTKGGKIRKERRMRLFRDLVERVFKKDGCIICFWLGIKEGWNDGNKHFWENCRFMGEEAVEIVMGLVKEVGEVGKDWSKRANSGCNWCWLPKCVCNAWVENEKGSWISRRKQGGKVGCSVRWMDVVCLGVCLKLLQRGGKESNDDIENWVRVRARVGEGKEEKEIDRAVYEWMGKRQLWCLRELDWRDGDEDEDEDGYYDFDGTNKGNRGWRDGIETNGLCCLIWKCREAIWKGLEEMDKGDG